jgi:hypothetical protein
MNITPASDEAAVEYEMVERIPEERGQKHRVVDVHIENWDERFLSLDAAQLGVRRLSHLNVQPLDGFWNVYWNGDTNDPILGLDPIPENESMTVRVEVIGS